MVIKMENRCVTCGVVMPEGDHICKFCKQCLEDTVGEKILVTDEMLKMKLDPVMLSFNSFDVKIENSVSLLEILVKYYIFKTNMNIGGNFNYGFIYKNIIPGEDIRDTANRLFEEYNGVVNTIESIFIKK